MKTTVFNSYKFTFLDWIKILRCYRIVWESSYYKDPEEMVQQTFELSKVKPTYNFNYQEQHERI